MPQRRPSQAVAGPFYKYTSMTPILPTYTLLNKMGLACDGLGSGTNKIVLVLLAVSFQTSLPHIRFQRADVAASSSQKYTEHLNRHPLQPSGPESFSVISRAITTSNEQLSPF